MQAVGVEPGDVFDDRELELGAAAPDAVADQFGLEAVDEALGERVVVGVTDRPDRRQELVVVEGLAVVERGVLGGFKWSSQHLDGGGVSWGRCGSGSGRFSCIGGKCPRRGGRRWRGAMTASGSGPRLLVG